MDTPSEAAPPGRWLLLALLFTGLAFNYIDRTALSVATPAMIKELHLTTAGMGVLLSAFFWPYSLLQVPLGWLVDRIGAKQLYAWSFLLWCLAAALSGLAGSFGALIATRILLGVGQAPVFPASTRAVAVYFPVSERGLATGIYTTGVRAGIIIATAGGAVILTAYGWKNLFIISGLSGLPFLALWFWFFRAFPPPARATVKSASLTLKALLPMLRHPAAWGVALGFLCYDYAWYVYATWLPGYLTMERHFSLKQTGVFASLPLVCMSIAMPLSGYASDRVIARGYNEIRVRQFFLTAGLLIACLIVPAGMVSSPYRCVALLTASLIGLGFAAPNTWTITTAIAPREWVGTLAGFQNFWGNIGGVVAPFITGYIAYVTGSFALALSFTGVMLVAGCLCYLFLVPGKIGEVS